MEVHKLKKEELESLTKGLEKKEDVIDEEVAIGWDGNNLLMRIPKELAEFLGLNKENRFKKNFRFIITHDVDGKITRIFEVVDRKTPKKKNGEK